MYFLLGGGRSVSTEGGLPRSPPRGRGSSVGEPRAAWRSAPGLCIFVIPLTERELLEPHHVERFWGLSKPHFDLPFGCQLIWKPTSSFPKMVFAIGVIKIQLCNSPAKLFNRLASI